MSFSFGRRRKLILTLIILELIVVGTASVAILAAGHTPLNALLFLGVSGTPIVALTVFCIAGKKTHEQKIEPLEPPDTSPDSVQFRYRRAFFYLPIFVGIMSMVTIRDSLHIITHQTGPVSWWDYMSVLGQLCIVFPYAWTLTRRGMGEQSRAADDELFARNRLSGQQTGFFVAVCGLLVAYIVGLLSPDWGIALLPSVGGIAVAAAGLRFALLDRAAEPNG
jgi:hypothetical protein